MNGRQKTILAFVSLTAVGAVVLGALGVEDLTLREVFSHGLAYLSGGATLAVASSRKSTRQGSGFLGVLGLACLGATLAGGGMGGCSVQPRGDSDSYEGAGRSITLSGDSYRIVDSGGRPIQGTIIDADGLHKTGNNGGRSAAIGFPMVNADGELVLFDREIYDAEGVVVGSQTEPVMLRFWLDDQSNTTIDTLRVPFGNSHIELVGFGADEAARITALNEQIIASVQAQVELSQAQLEAVRAQMAAGVDVVTALAEIGVRLAVPTP